MSIGRVHFDNNENPHTIKVNDQNVNKVYANGNLLWAKGPITWGTEKYCTTTVTGDSKTQAEGLPAGLAPHRVLTKNDYIYQGEFIKAATTANTGYYFSGNSDENWITSLLESQTIDFANQNAIMIHNGHEAFVKYYNFNIPSIPLNNYKITGYTITVSKTESPLSDSIKTVGQGVGILTQANTKVWYDDLINWVSTLKNGWEWTIGTAHLAKGEVRIRHNYTISLPTAKPIPYTLTYTGRHINDESNHLWRTVSETGAGSINTRFGNNSIVYWGDEINSDMKAVTGYHMINNMNHFLINANSINPDTKIVSYTFKTKPNEYTLSVVPVHIESYSLSATGDSEYSDINYRSIKDGDKVYYSEQLSTKQVKPKLGYTMATVPQDQYVYDLVSDPNGSHVTYYLEADPREYYLKCNRSYDVTSVTIKVSDGQTYVFSSTSNPTNAKIHEEDILTRSATLNDGYHLVDFSASETVRYQEVLNYTTTVKCYPNEYTLQLHLTDIPNATFTALGQSDYNIKSRSVNDNSIVYTGENIGINVTPTPGYIYDGPQSLPVYENASGNVCNLYFSGSLCNYELVATIDDHVDNWYATDLKDSKITYAKEGSQIKVHASAKTGYKMVGTYPYLVDVHYQKDAKFFNVGSINTTLKTYKLEMHPDNHISSYTVWKGNTQIYNDTVVGYFDTLTVIPTVKAGYTFDGPSDRLVSSIGSDSTGKAAWYLYTSPRTYTLTFGSLSNIHEAHFTTINGTPTTTAEEGQQIKIYATPNTGYFVSGYPKTVTVHYQAGNPDYFNVGSISASPNPYTLRISADGGIKSYKITADGRSVTDGDIVYYGETLRVVPTVYNGYIYDGQSDVLVQNEISGSECYIQLTTKARTYTLTATLGNHVQSWYATNSSGTHITRASEGETIYIYGIPTTSAWEIVDNGRAVTVKYQDLNTFNVGTITAQEVLITISISTSNGINSYSLYDGNKRLYNGDRVSYYTTITIIPSVKGGYRYTGPSDVYIPDYINPEDGTISIYLSTDLVPWKQPSEGGYGYGYVYINNLNYFEITGYIDLYGYDSEGSSYESNHTQAQFSVPANTSGCKIDFGYDVWDIEEVCPSPNGSYTGNIYYTDPRTGKSYDGGWVHGDW